MKNNFTIVAYYTEKSPYKKIIEDYLKCSISIFDIPLKIYIEEDKGSWIKNVNLKPSVIEKALNELDTDILFLDADCQVNSYPVLIEEMRDLNIDIAYHELDWSTWYNRPNDKTKELLSGTLYLANNDKVKKMVKEWKLRAENSNQWEQKILEKLVKNYDLNIYKLPLEYTYINTLPNGKEPFIKLIDPIITHYQKSRDFKK